MSFSVISLFNRIWTQKDLYEQTAYAAEVGPKILQFYEEYFNVPFPLPKQDMIALPGQNNLHFDNQEIINKGSKQYYYCCFFLKKNIFWSTEKRWENKMLIIYFFF